MSVVASVIRTASIVLTGLSFAAGTACAQTYGLATMQPGTLANTVASAKQIAQRIS